MIKVHIYTHIYIYTSILFIYQIIHCFQYSIILSSTQCLWTTYLVFLGAGTAVMSSETRSSLCEGDILAWRYHKQECK